MRASLILAVTVLLTGTVAADDKSDRERRVRVALALAGGDRPAADSCGQCREDVAEARDEGVRDGKPVVLFVGGCPGGEWVTAVTAVGGIPVKAAEYAGDDRPKAEKRVVILEPKADRTGFVRVDVPKGGTATELREKVRQSVPKPANGKPLDWGF